jgi:homoserine kinase type II
MAVYTQLTNETIADLAEKDYGLGRLVFAVGIAQGVENSNYLLDLMTEDGHDIKTILTLYEKRVRPEELPFFLALMEHLAARGVNCPLPIKRRDGEVISTVEGRPAAMVSFLHGRSRTILRNPHVAGVGKALAGLHQAALGFAMTRANALSLPGWQSLAGSMRGQLNAIAPGLEILVMAELDYLTEHWPKPKLLPRGIIHADLFPDNVFFDEEHLTGIIDFYFACEDFFAYDLAIVLNAWCFEVAKEFNATKSRLLLQAYQSLRSFTPEEKQAFPVLLRGAALRFLLTRAYDLLHRSESALVTPKDPLEYLAKLRFHQQARGVGEYGLS